MRKTTSTIVLTAMLTVGIAGCTGGSPGGSANPSASASANRQQLLALAQDWVKCMRDNGMPRMPDAEVTPEGYLSFPPRGGYEWKSDLEKHPGIIDKCKSFEDKYPANAFRPKEQVSPEDLRKLTEYAKCFRQHGFPDFPDPDKSGTFDFTGTSLANGTSNRKRDVADEACKHLWDGPIKVTGGGGKK
ncbi:hypothetical protein AB0M20_26185 [Actinoplanes sp. NPDC051633]|uniref:hypothetical protein n=1 Tax=Actinoplanes sp. NPDC051633 TaxID=3155670 RepID=UPI00343B75CA